jgi:hypothetical protein
MDKKCMSRECLNMVQEEKETNIQLQFPKASRLLGCAESVTLPLTERDWGVEWTSSLQHD